MSALLEIWEELFDAAPSPAEETVMSNLARVVDPNDTSFILCAVVVRFLNRSLLLDPSSPVNLAGRLGKGLQDLNAATERLERRLNQFDSRLNSLSGSAFMTLDALAEARKFSEERRRIPPPVRKQDRYTGLDHWQHTLAPNALLKIGLTCTFASFFGGAFLLMLILAFL